MRDMESQGARRLEPSLIRTVLDRAAALRGEGHKVIPFSAGEPNFDTPSPIKAAAQRAIEENYTHYTSNRGLPSLRAIIAKMMEQATGASYDPETEIIVTSSGAEALNNTIHAFVGEGDEVIIPTPAFVSYKNLVKFTGAAVVEVPLSPGECFRLDAKAIEAKITPRTKMTWRRWPGWRRSMTCWSSPTRCTAGWSTTGRSSSLWPPCPACGSGPL